MYTNVSMCLILVDVGFAKVNVKLDRLLELRENACAGISSNSENEIVIGDLIAASYSTFFNIFI